jgi:transposase-like protein
MPVDQLDDPACPKCHCQNNELVRTTVAFGMHTQRWRCGFCGHGFPVTLAKDQPMQAAKAAAFDHDPSAPVAYHSEAVRCTCPYCQARNPPVTRTMPKVNGVVTRYHDCACGRTFKSQEA